MINKFVNMDCMELMKKIPNDKIDLTLTDIPYDGVNRKDNGLRKITKEAADVITFDLEKFLEETYRITKSTIIIFCGQGQLSEIFKFFLDKQMHNKGTVRQLVWIKKNPSPMNGQHIYLSGIENAVWFKKRGGTFNAHCKNTAFSYPIGSSKIHPTEKNHNLLKELIEDNSNKGDLVFDPCAGSGSTLMCSKELDRQYIGCELNEEYYKVANERLLSME